MTFIPNDRRVEFVSVADLLPDPNNPRRHSDKQVEKIISSVRRFGFRGALIIDEQNRVIAGNAVLAAVRRLGISEVPVIRETFLSDAERRAFVLAHNRLAELADWDQEALNRELEFLFDGGLTFDGTGFEFKDLDFSLDEPPQEEAVELPQSGAEAVSRRGDLWHIGSSLRLYCGDSRLAESYETVLADEVAAMVFSDPPYGVRIDGFARGHGKVRHREFAMMSGGQTPPELTAFLRRVFRNCVRFSGAGSIHFQCADWRHLREYLDAAEGVYGELKNLIVWNKGVGGQGAFYRSQHELILAFKAGKGRHINNFGLGETGRYRTNIWDYPGVNSFRAGRARDLEDHPTVKNSAMVADAILDCSNRGDLILDPFCGSGTTLLAAHRTKRRGAAIEIDPLYVDTTLRRITEATGLVATLSAGRDFEEVAAERSGADHGR